MGFTHPMQDFMDLIVKTEMTDDNQVITKVNLSEIDKCLPQSEDDGNGDDISWYEPSDTIKLDGADWK